MTRAWLIIAALMCLLLPSAPAMRACQPGFSHLSARAVYNVTDDADDFLGTSKAVAHAAKPWKRRFSSRLIGQRPIGPASFDTNDALRSENRLRPGGGSEFCAVLASSWQFQRRAAPSPRAPSLVF